MNFIDNKPSLIPIKVMQLPLKNEYFPGREMPHPFCMTVDRFLERCGILHVHLRMVISTLRAPRGDQDGERSEKCVFGGAFERT